MNREVRAHILAEQRLRARTTQAIAKAWRGLSSYDETDVPAFLADVVPFMLASQRASATVTNAYIARRLGRTPVALNPALVTGAALRAGAPPAEVYRRPFVTVWTALKAGSKYEEAVNAGLARAVGMAANDVQLAARATFAAVQERDSSIFGYQRVADPDACEFCQLVDGAYVKNADAMPLHNNCGCSLEPLTSPHPRAVTLPDGTRIRDFQGGPLINTPPPDGVAVHEHGELGPVLADPAQHFTTV